MHERNIRVVYLRPFAHQWDMGKGPLSIEATNVEIVRQIADGVRKYGLRLGGASPIYAFTVAPWLIVLASLAIPAMLLLLLDLLGVRDRRWMYAILAVDLLFVLFHEDLRFELVRDADNHGGGTGVDAHLVLHDQLFGERLDSRRGVAFVHGCR